MRLMLAVPATWNHRCLNQCDLQLVAVLEVLLHTQDGLPQVLLTMSQSCVDDGVLVYYSVPAWQTGARVCGGGVPSGMTGNYSNSMTSICYDGAGHCWVGVRTWFE